MSKAILISQTELELINADSGESSLLSGESKSVEKGQSKGELRAIKIINRAKVAAAKIVAKAKKQSILIVEKAKSKDLLYAEKRKKKSSLLAKNISDSAQKHKAVYRVTNWKTYNESLKARGEITLYLSPKVLRDWQKVSKKK